MTKAWLLWSLLGPASVASATAGPVASTSPATATTEKSTVAPEALHAIAVKVEKSKSDIEAEELKRRRVLSALYKINKQIRKTVSETTKMQGERSVLEDNIQRLNERLGELDHVSTKLQARLSERLRVLYRLGGPTAARFFLSAGSSSELDRNLKILGLIAERDRALIQEYRETRREIDTKRAKLAKRSRRLDEVAKDLRTREHRLVAEQGTKNRLLDGIRKKHLFALRNLQDIRDGLKKNQIGDDTVLDVLFKPSFADEKGRLPAPVPGTLLQTYGMEKSPIHRWMLSHKGIRLSAAAGQPVKAVFGGTVAWTGEITGLGQTVIIDHGDHYYTVYSETADLKVRSGEEVARDQVIAAVARSSWESQTGLHFEIRHFSEPDDPRSWMKGTTL